MKNFFLRNHSERGPISVITRQSLVAKGHDYLNQEVGPQANPLSVGRVSFFLG